MSSDKTAFVGLNIPVAPPQPKKFISSQTMARRHRLLKKQRGMCAYCDEPLSLNENATIDHIRPKSKGGSNRENNLVLVCHWCNSMKGDISSVEEANERIFKFSEFVARLAARGYLK